MLEFLGLVRPQIRDDPGVDNPLRAASGQIMPPVRIVSRELAVETQYEEPVAVPGASRHQDRGHATFSLVPGPGTHWFRYRGVWMRLQRERNGKLVDLSTGAPWETVTLTTLSSYEHLFSQLLSEARQLALSSTQGNHHLYKLGCRLASIRASTPRS